MSCPYILNEYTQILTFYYKGKQYQIEESHKNYKTIRDGVFNDADMDNLVKLLSAETLVSEFFSVSSLVSIKNRCVYVGDEKVCVGNAILDRIFNFIDGNLPTGPMYKFLENIVNNPSYQSRQQLYLFLEHKNLPITSDGCFLAYKAVTLDYLDLYSKTICNEVGEIVSMPRSNIDDNPNNECGTGLHVGTLNYVSSYGGHNYKCMVVKINPKDVVSVPTNSGCEKLRTCSYTVMAEYKDKLPEYYSDDYDNYEDYENYDEDEDDTDIYEEDLNDYDSDYDDSDYNDDDYDGGNYNDSDYDNEDDNLGYDTYDTV